MRSVLRKETSQLCSKRKTIRLKKESLWNLKSKERRLAYFKKYPMAVQSQDSKQNYNLSSNQNDKVKVAMNHNINISEVNNLSLHNKQLNCSHDDSCIESFQNDVNLGNSDKKSDKLIRDKSLTYNFIDSLRDCFLNADINHLQGNKILKVLRTHDCFKYLPKDSRTILQTKRDKIETIVMEDGFYYHIGFINTLQIHLNLFETVPSLLKIELSTDGLTLSRNNPHQFWPIQCLVKNIDGFKPLIIGLYQGPVKPSDATILFNLFLNEVDLAHQKGGLLVNNVRVPFVFTSFIADAPARALVLNHYGHNATHPCSKCNIEGERYENRVMTYMGIDNAPKTDNDYLNEAYDGHHKGKTILGRLGISPVTQVPFEIMHLVYIGVTGKLLEAWFTGKYGYHAKLDSHSIKELSNRYMNLLAFCPKEFARRPKPLLKYSKFKATELRHFLLYAGPTVLRGILSNDLYYHFLNLHTAMRILTAKNLTEDGLQLAKKCLQLFVHFAPILYCPYFVSYNVHALLHIVDDARTFGPLEECSAFVYENRLPYFRNSIRNHPKPLHQYIKRLQEKKFIQFKLENNSKPRVSCRHVTKVPRRLEGVEQYKQFNSKLINFSLNKADCYGVLENKVICKIENILLVGGRIRFLIRKFRKITSLFTSPIVSLNIGIFKCKKLSRKLIIVPISKVRGKCYLMPLWNEQFVYGKSNMQEEKYVVSILLHHLN